MMSRRGLKQRSLAVLAIALAGTAFTPSADAFYPPKGPPKLEGDKDKQPQPEGEKKELESSEGETEELEDEGPKLGMPGEPGSGVPREVGGQTDPSKLGVPGARKPRNDDEKNALRDLEEMYNAYEDAADATGDSVRDLLIITGDKDRDRVRSRYDRDIRSRRAKARVLRDDAIVTYEGFLEKHSDDPAWTPEIMFRLAELEFESSNERYQAEEDAWERQLALYEDDIDAGRLEKDAEPPAAPTFDYKKSVGLFRTVVSRFPTYPHNDAALYMMGMLLYEEEEYDASRQSFLALACNNHFPIPTADQDNLRYWEPGKYSGCKPYIDQSKFIEEAWLRVGESHYDFDEFSAALAAYTQAASDPKSEFYYTALIRIAWTLYLERRFPEAIAKFDEFVKHADSVRGTDEGEGVAEFREDAIKYMAKAYVEEDWDLDGVPDNVWGYERLDRDYGSRGAEPHVAEIYRELGELFAFQTEYAQAIGIWQATLNRWPNAPAAPSIQLKILRAYEFLQDKDGATTARDALATNYLRGTEWFYANEDNPDAIEEAFQLAEDALVATAVDHHSRAQQLRSGGQLEEANKEYAIAAVAYEAYLERFPDTKASYEYRYQFAESLYYSDQLLDAAVQYSIVRDSNISNKLQKDAAEGVIFAYEGYIDDEREAGRFALPPMPKRDMNGPWDPKDIPELVLALQEAYDRYVSYEPEATEAPRMMYDAASISQRYNRFEDAERRYVRVLEDHCQDNVAINAGYAIIDGRLVQGDLKGTQEWTKKLVDLGCGSGAESEKFAGELKTIGNAAIFEEATQLFDAGKYEAAADRYVALVNEAPNDPQADAALFNAAASYERIGRFNSAAATYERIYTEYKKSEYADDALLRTGFNHSKFFEFEKAVGKYLILAEDEQFKDSEHRLVALKNAASLLENLQEYNRAHKMYKKWGAATKDPADKAEASFRAAKVLIKTGENKKTIKAFNAFLKSHKKTPGQAERIVESHLRIGQAYAEEKERKKAESAYRSCVSSFASLGLAPATEAADYPAEAQFKLAEYSLGDVLKVKPKGQGKKLEKSIKTLFDKVLKAANEYDAVFPYRRLEWVLAAMYRRGYAFETVATKVRDAPVPKQLKEYSEAWFAYKDIVDSEMERFETKAISLYEETVKRGREYQISNQWTRRAVERLNLWKPEEYPLLRDPALEMELEDRR